MLVELVRRLETNVHVKIALASESLKFVQDKVGDQGVVIFTIDGGEIEVTDTFETVIRSFGSLT